MVKQVMKINISNKVKEIINVNENTIITLSNLQDEVLTIITKNSCDLTIDIKENVNIKINHLVIDSEFNIIINLHNENSMFDFNQTIINKINNKSSIKANHLASNTKGNVLSHILNLGGEIFIDVSNKVIKSAYNCEADQNTMIVNLTENPVGVIPTLLIDNYQVVANHSAFVGGFDNEVIFYLLSRGIPKNEGYNLLIKSFLVGHLEIGDELKEEILKNINIEEVQYE